MDKRWDNLREKINLQKRYIDFIPDNIDLYRLLIAGEDHRFKFHKGVDFIALIRATWKTVIFKQREGGSTIAMQLVRVLTAQYDKTIVRKIQEILLAHKLTKYISQKEILELYLSIAYFGCNMHGIKQACDLLNYNLYNLNIEESASLIARLKYPEPKYASEDRKQQITRRTKYILKRYHTLKIKERYDSF